jgi:aromatic-L-amino-acid decarboxylase
LWLVIRHYGVEGLQFYIRRHVALAQEFASWVGGDPDFELVAPAPLNLVCFRHRAGDEASQAIMDSVNRSGRAFLSHTRLRDRLVLRLCVGQARTEERHVRAAWGLIKEAAAKM